MNRFALAVLLVATIVVTNISCGSNSASSDPASTVENARKLAADAPAVPESKPLDPKALITDDKLSRFIIYQREANTVADIALGAATQAINKSGGSQAQFQKELSRDERTAKIAAAQKSALEKSGLGQMEAVEITKIVTPFVAGATIGDAEMKQKARDEFKAKYGADALAVMEKNLPELSKLQDEMLSAVFKKK